MKLMTKNSINNKENDLKKKPLNNLYTGNLLDNLKSGEHVSLEGDNGSFVFYKNDENGFWIHHNSAWINFINNPMTQNEMENVLEPIISHADNLESKIPHDLLIRLKDMFWGKDKRNEWKDFTVEDFLRNITLNNILSTLEFKKELLKETEHKVSEWIVGYLENATNILNELVSQYPENSVIRNKIQDKLNYLESYKKTFSDWKFVEWIKNNVSDLNNLLDILENQDPEWELASQIKDLRNKKTQNDFSGEIKWFFDKIYSWDAFAIPYSTFGDRYWIAWSVDQWTKAFAELNWWDKWSEEINRLWKKQESLMDDKLSFIEKEKIFKDANQEYLDSIWFILGTGRNALPSTGGYYKWIHDEIELDDFISMPCSDIYPAVLQKTILPFYLEDLYKESCELLWEKSMDKSLDKYVDWLKNPSWFAKLSSALNKKSNENKIESLRKISEKIWLLRKKFDSLDKQIRSFWDKNKEALIKMASEFCVIEDFVKIDNTNVYSPFTMSNQDKRLDFMRKN